jgi:Flp pilus assembly protein TadD
MRQTGETVDERLGSVVRKWAEKEATLQDVRGYTDEELYAIARTAYAYFHQGRSEDARVLFQGLFAVNPMDPYFARALGVVEFAAGDSQAALAAWDEAIKLAPNDPSVWVGRAEVRLVSGERAGAEEDLRRAGRVAPRGHPLRGKIDALLRVLAPLSAGPAATLSG